MPARTAHMVAAARRRRVTTTPLARGATLRMQGVIGRWLAPALEHFCPSPAELHQLSESVRGIPPLNCTLRVRSPVSMTSSDGDGDSHSSPGLGATSRHVLTLRRGKGYSTVSRPGEFGTNDGALER